jgi:hypothetical protein
MQRGALLFDHLISAGEQVPVLDSQSLDLLGEVFGLQLPIHPTARKCNGWRHQQR